MDDRRSVIAMGDSNKGRGDYRIEISGWGLDNSFFTEGTELLWTSDGEKQVEVHRALGEGSIVFVRLLSSEPINGSVPVAYQVEDVGPMDRNGRCLMKLAQLHPRSRQSRGPQYASKKIEGETEGRSRCEASEIVTELEPEEALR
jgi:hypothetical protein